jgi:hypothetical protein
VQEKSDLTSSFLAARRQKATSNPSLIIRASEKQRAYIRDREALVTYLAGRRHGKTDGVATRMIEHARPETVQAYVGPTITRAKEILVPVLRTLQREAGVRFEIIGDHVIFPSGGRIRFMGMSNEAEVQKLRGEDLLAAYFDECGVPKSRVLKEAVISCAWEALRKHRGEPGSGVSMSGTPGPVPGNQSDAEPDFWWQVTTQQNPDGSNMYGASRHFGLIFDNPIFAGGKAEASIAEDLRKKIYISREDSRFRREVLAQWCLPSELRCYSAFGKLVLPQSSAPWQGRTVMAVDFGWHDHTAIVILRLTDWEKTTENEDGSSTVTRGERVHVLHAEKRQHWKLPDLAAELLRLRELFHVGTVVGDSGGGASAQVVQSFASMFGLPMLAAQKSGMGALKRSRIHTINDLIAIGHIVLYEGAQCLADELGYLVWNEDRDDHDERQGDHAADAFGYAVIETYVPISEERLASQAEQELEAREAQKRAMLSRRR